MATAAAVQAHETAARQSAIFVVVDDWRTRHFICTILKYSTRARVVESSHAQEALQLAQKSSARVDLLIANVGMELAHEIAGRHASAKVLLMSGRSAPPNNLPGAWRFLSIPFQTSVFLQCVSELGKLK
jgi:DNA-binding NtrC family response regulator